MSGVKTTFRLALACAAVFAATRLVERGEFRLSPSQNRPMRLVSRRLEEVDHVVLTDADGLSRKFRLTPDGWAIEAPFSAPASDSAVKQLLDAIEAAPLMEFIDDDEVSLRDLSHSDFGLGTAPHGTIEVSGPRTAIKIHLGSLSVDTNETFVSVEGSGGISVTDPILVRCFERPIEEFTDRRFCRANLRETDTVLVERPGEAPLRIKRTGDRRGWEILSPETRHADWGQMVKFFEALSTARIASVVSEADGAAAPEAADGPAAGQRAAEPAVTIRLYEKNAPLPATVSILGPTSGDSGLVLAVSDSGLEVTLPERTAKAISIRVGDVRDRKVFASGHTLGVTSVAILGPEGVIVSASRPSGRDWELAAPIAAKANQEKISQLLGEMLSLEADAFIPAAGLSEGTADGSPVISEGPVFTLGTHSATNRIECRFLPAANGTTNALVVVDASDFAAVVPTDEIASLLAAAAAPQVLLSTNIAAISAKNLLSVKVEKDGSEPVVIEFAPDGTWSTSGGAAEGDATRPAGEFVFADIAARRVVALLSDQKTDEDCQLAHPQLTATFTFRDASSEPLALSFGTLTPDGAGVYAHVGGRSATYDLPVGIFYALERIAAAKR